MSDDYIDIATTNKNLKHRIKQDITGPTDKVYWYISFNIPLDASSVNDDTMCVMDIRGNPLATLITYSSPKNTIIINPLMPYRPNEPYILTVFCEVRSANGNNLKEDVQVVFKLKGTEITDYTLLKGRELINTDTVDQHRANVKKRQALGMSAENSMKSDKLYKAPLNLNPILGAIGTVAVFVFVFTKLYYGIIVAVLLLMAGIVHLVMQFFNRKSKSMKLYNDGVKLYNSGDLRSATLRFENALVIDVDNDFARYGLARANSYGK